MGEREPVDAATALSKFFDVVSEEAAANPQFARRLLEAASIKVVFRGDEATAAVDPMLVAMEGYDEFRRTFGSMTVAQVKKIAKNAGLITQQEKLPTGLFPLIDLLWDRASQQVHDRYPRREAAE